MGFDNLPIHHNATASPPPPPPPVSTHIPHRPSSLLLHMSFYWGKNAQVLFSGWPGNNSFMYGLAVTFVFFLAILVEFFSNINIVKQKPDSNRAAAVFFQMGIHSIRAGFAYLVMLSVMSFNGGVFIAAVVGHAVGYVLFGSPIFKKRNQ
ncbi:hypothetical protein M9H77_03855 [Catharanthus roseus]|uniref:Uncharacterized protein n=1 Tax=Catharanthus roseus TaxID=4058 RepID=A0ACC0CCE3_CATRO|nr:hypothetical protein M9H77_03855 [Catharanthus roseus]